MNVFIGIFLWIAFLFIPQSASASLPCTKCQSGACVTYNCQSGQEDCGVDADCNTPTGGGGGGGSCTTTCTGSCDFASTCASIGKQNASGQCCTTGTKCCKNPSPPTSTPTPSPTPAPLICDDNFLQGSTCSNTNYCGGCSPGASSSCLNLTSTQCGNCYCTQTTPAPGCSCGAWGACELDASSGQYCQTRHCDIGASCNCATDPSACAYQIQCGCTPSGGGGSTPTPGNCQGLNKVCITNSNCCAGLICNQTSHRCVNAPTPTPAVGSIRSRAMVVTSADTSCAAVGASTTGLAGTVHQFTAGSASQPPAQTQSGSTYTQFNSLPIGTYTLDAIPPSGYLLKRSCWTKTLGGSSGEGLSQGLIANDTLTWNLGYTLGDAWVQVQGGDVYASGTITSLTPQAASPRLFDLDGDGGDPGVVTYGSSYDFAIETTGNDPLGVNQVSNNKWLVNETYQTVNWYDTFYQRFGSPTTVDYDCTVSPCTITKPTSRPTAYYVTGDMTTSGNWSIGDGETIIFIITGDLTLGGSINITGKGFVGFVVNGDITVSSSVGSLYSDASPDIEGVYITSPTGTFATGASSVVNKERLILKGTFVAGNFLLERDLASVGHNDDTSAELFIYNPMLLITMPEAMKEIKVAWQEVAP